MTAYAQILCQITRYNTPTYAEIAKYIYMSKICVHLIIKYIFQQYVGQPASMEVHAYNQIHVTVRVRRKDPDVGSVRNMISFLLFKKLFFVNALRLKKNYAIRNTMFE